MENLVIVFYRNESETGICVMLPWLFNYFRMDGCTREVNPKDARLMVN